jgi:AcrR family transcriptional regulator
MSSADDKSTIAGMSRATSAVPSPTRRRHDARASRSALVDAASTLFDERGYEATTIRQIGERAGVDPALIARYFGGKEGLYLATLTEVERPPLPSEPSEAFAALLHRGETQGIGPVPLGMVNPNLTDDMRAQLQEIVDVRVIAPLAATMAERGIPDAKLRAELLLATAIGVTLIRASGSLPMLAKAPLSKVQKILAASVDGLQATGVR